MNIAQAKQQVKDTIEAYLAKDETGAYRISPSQQRPIFLLGAPGIGKTAIMSQIASELGIGLVSYSMTHHTRQSALGLPMIVHHNFDSLEYESTEYTMSEIIASIYDNMTRTGRRSGILFLDEINCVSETLYPSMLQFLQFKTFGRHKVPADWIVVCAGNPPEYNKSVHEFDIVTLDRLRKIDIEPDYQAWRKHAIDKGVHPAVLSFLEIKKECFYSVESTPEGKRFVTARGWDDLSEMIALLESIGKPVDGNLICQFLQDDEISDRFATYYDLFNKYRSDYQIDTILDGSASIEIAERAKGAAFDEKIALINLMVDAIGSDATDALVAYESVEALRGMLSSEKGRILEGCNVSALLDELIAREEKEMAVKSELDAKSIEVRALSETIAALKAFKAQCVLASTPSGEAAFDTIRYEYRGRVAKLEQLASRVGGELDNAFAFIDETLPSGKENMVFVTELTARHATSKFIGIFGNDSYYAHNDDMLVDERRSTLVARIAEIEAENASEGLTGASRAEVGKPEAPANANRTDIETLRAYYSGSQFEYGFSSLCKMTLPMGLDGMNVVDVGCRRGKGVFKLSARVGNTGKVLGIDWSDAFISEARLRMDRAWRDSGLKGNNMRFEIGYPERIDECGVADSSADMIFVNSVLNLSYNMREALEGMFRALKPGGLLICETVTASGARDADVVEKAKAIGNSIQSAISEREFMAMLGEIGFSNPHAVTTESVKPSDGALPSNPVPTIESDESVEFTAMVVHARKPM